MLTFRHATVAAAVALTCGCGEGSIFREFSVDRGSSLTLDEKQRVVTNTAHHEYVDGLNPQGVKQSYLVTTRVICAEPSPDVATAISKSFAGSLTGALSSRGTDASAAAALSRNFAQQLVQLGERTVAIQLLRDALYRACEAYANKAIDQTAYALLLSRFDTLAATLVLAELGSGAVGRALAAISSTAGEPRELTQAEQKALDDSRAALDTAIRERVDAEVAVANKEAAVRSLGKDDPPEKAASATQQLEEAKVALRGKEKFEADRRAALGRLETAATRAGRATGTGQGSGGLGASPATVAKHVTDAMVQMQRQYFMQVGGDLSALTAACISHLDEKNKSSAKIFLSVCQQLLSTLTNPQVIPKIAGMRYVSMMAATCASYPSPGERATCQRQIDAVIRRM